MFMPSNGGPPTLVQWGTGREMEEEEETEEETILLSARAGYSLFCMFFSLSFFLSFLSGILTSFACMHMGWSVNVQSGQSDGDLFRWRMLDQQVPLPKRGHRGDHATLLLLGGAARAGQGRQRLHLQ